ncbi:hypothetical protein F2P81_024341 [Scophthalmus maximus]|uniref:Uncharacterized protein n=1 Tax=Scophthalmus maximus TaxID=52904 RepID=A0A6A4RXA9_SCOMX|nr:hypothetical protein F2P81_024341 [Scophthalmus maximus]
MTVKVIRFKSRRVIGSPVRRRLPLSCSPYIIHIGNPSTCSRDGDCSGTFHEYEISSLPTGLFQTPTNGRCARPPGVQHGDLLNQTEANRGSFPPGTLLTYGCEPGYTADGPTTIICTSSGAWSHQPPRCLRSNVCSPPTEPENGGYRCHPSPCHRLTQKTVIEYFCDEGYALKGDYKFLTCQNGEWDSSMQISCRLTQDKEPSSPLGIPAMSIVASTASSVALILLLVVLFVLVQPKLKSFHHSSYVVAEEYVCVCRNISNMSGCRIFIGRLSPSAREKDVERFFKGYGRIRDIDLKRGFGFVEFDDPRDAEDAVYELDGKELCNESRNPPPMRTENRLIVENLSSRVSWQDLKDFMRQAGEVTFADAHRPKLNEGVVEFASYSDLKNALEKLSGKEINGRKIKLIEAAKKR